MIHPLASQIFQHYPRRESGATAEKAILKALKLLQKEEQIPLCEAHEKLLRATVKYAKHREYLISSGKSEKAFTPHPATWFNGARYNDEEQWEMPVEPKSNIPAQEWAEKNWGPILEAYSIKWGDPRYFSNSWGETYQNLPAAVRADLKYLKDQTIL